MTLFSREMLLATNGSEEAELAARVAVELAKSPGGAIAKKHRRSRTVVWSIASPFLAPRR
jgi:nucleotide-binding universal stress UspA family protein